MSLSPISIRPFIGSKDYDLSRRFYAAVGFEEVVLFPDMSVFKLGAMSFYLQRYYAAEWVNNTMVFLEVEDVLAAHRKLQGLNLPEAFPGARLDPIRHEEWGFAFGLIDPAGVLWHIGAFKKED
ncbi:MAG: glyoxalase [Chitinophagaceae bacterium]|nr:MAG: glyoxalase [Chitinophagaceae bacterium]